MESRRVSTSADDKTGKSTPKTIKEQGVFQSPSINQGGIPCSAYEQININFLQEGYLVNSLSKQTQPQRARLVMSPHREHQQISINHWGVAVRDKRSVHVQKSTNGTETRAAHNPKPV
ncbi:hypothetical protein NDU88_005666 [Pleurodeles waltl]|uniref:Uncharacterized protein n=1 Tax=Pleurodeles waltl TaxID=8319 RepID=A0AAV7SMA8_PLEWA|nr:hypothetical protein NDU88_005666 [Pleurodeles waltl]